MAKSNFGSNCCINIESLNASLTHGNATSLSPEFGPLPAPNTPTVMQRVRASTTVVARQSVLVGEKRGFSVASLKRHIVTAFDGNQCGNVLHDHMSVSSY